LPGTPAIAELTNTPKANKVEPINLWAKWQGFIKTPH
jgi:hypothetical protein